MSSQRIYNPTLNPVIWDENQNIRNEVSNALLTISTDFYEDTKLKAKLKDVLLLGSSANYNWTPTSDIDLHLVVDIKEIGVDPASVRNYLESLKSKWNYEHTIKIQNHNVEVYIQDLNHVTHATGIYSLINGMWTVKPHKEHVVLDRELIKSKYNDFVYKINKVIHEPSIPKIKTVIDDIYKMRQSGLDASGELSTENIVFKLLRNNGYIEKLKQLKISIYDKSVSL